MVNSARFGTNSSTIRRARFNKRLPATTLLMLSRLSIGRERLAAISQVAGFRRAFRVVLALHQDQRIRTGSFMSFGRAVHDVATNPECCGPAAIQIQGLLSAELDHV